MDAGDAPDAPPLLLFDLNGTLTSHTFVRRSCGRNRMRPGTNHLRRLQVSVAPAPDQQPGSTSGFMQTECHVLQWVGMSFAHDAAPQAQGTQCICV